MTKLVPVPVSLASENLLQWRSVIIADQQGYQYQAGQSRLTGWSMHASREVVEWLAAGKKHKFTCC